MQIPSWPQAGERETELLASVLASPQWGGFHPFIQEFEQSFAAYQGARFGISAANGTLTLEMALTVLGIGLGDEVIVPAVSFISSATAVSRVGALPVFVDLESWSFNIDPDRVLEAITPRTRAIMPVHFGGALAEIERLRTIASEHGLHLIEDAAHAHGSSWNGQGAGSFGICGSFSFQNGKVLCAGEGGMLLTNEECFAEKARALANQGRKPGESFYKHFSLGSNLRMTAFQAAVLLAQFERLPEHIEHRTANVTLLKNLLSDVDEIRWQEQTQQTTRNCYYLLPGRFTGSRVARNEFTRKLNVAGVPCTPFYPFPLYRNPLYLQPGSCRAMPCPVAEAYVDDAFWLPHRVLLADSDSIVEIAAIIRSALITGG